MAYVRYEGPDVVSQAMLDQLDNLTNQYTSLALKLAAAEGDREAALTSWMETTDLPAAVKIRNLIETNQKKLRELAETNVESSELSEEDKAKLQAELSTLKDKVKSGRGVVENLIGSLSSDPEGVKAALATIDDPVKSNRGRKAGTAGSNLPRVSARVTIHGGNFDDQNAVNEFDSFSAAANALNADVKEMQLAFAKAAGVEHQAISSVKKPVVFEFQAHENGPTYQVETTPKQRQKPGPRAKADTKPAESNSEAA